MTNKKYKAFSLFSGGLDSVLAAKVLENIGIETIPVFIESPFFKSDKAKTYAKKFLKNELVVFDISEKYLEMLLNPKYGYGKNMNPCIDCHGIMFNTLKEKMEEMNVDFIASGEVLGQRPKSQRKDALNSVAKLSGIKDLIVRPLCQKLLQDTLPIREKWIDKEKLYDIQGRNRKRQFALAKEFGIDEYENPGGGCLLTDKDYSYKLKELISHNELSIRNIEFLKFGRHFRISDDTKLIVSRNAAETKILAEIASEEICLETSNFPGPLGILLQKEKNTSHYEFAAQILLSYNNKAENIDYVSFGEIDDLNKKIKVEKLDKITFKDIMITFQ